MKKSFIIEPVYKADSCVIWLHGLGSSGKNFDSLLSKLQLKKSHAIRFIFPNAPILPVTINNGVLMPAWYDIRLFNNINQEIDHLGILSSMKRINNIIESQINVGINSNNIILAGFSQGGVIAGLSAICSNYKFAGVLLLSTYLPDWKYFRKHMTQNNCNTPFIIAHGSDDSVIPLKISELLQKNLRDVNFNVKSYIYSMNHSICDEEINMISNFIKKKLC